MQRISPGSITGVALVCAALSLPTLAADWPQWRGTHRDGRSAETGLMGEWPEGGPPLAWKAEGLGSGFSSVSVVAGRIYTMGDLGDRQHVLALEEGSGKILWKVDVGPHHDDEYLGPRSTPTIDGDSVYVLTTEGDVYCLAAKDGTQRWHKNLVEAYDGFLMKAKGSYDWKFSESPLVDGDRVIVTPGHTGAMLVALNRKTGEEIWRTHGKPAGERGVDGAGYSSPIVAEIHGKRQYIQLVGRGVIGVDAESGGMLWSYNRVANDIANIPTPIVHGEYVFTSTGYGTGAGLIRIGKGDAGFKAEEVYFLEAGTMQNHHGGLILEQGVVYTGTGHNKGFPIAVHLESGKVAWGPVRNKGTGSAAVAYADGRLYFRYQNGLMVLFEATPEEYREVGSFMIPEVEHPSWARPVIANGKLYLREQDNLFVYDIGDKKTEER